MQPPRTSERARGVTLIELLVVVALVSILLAVVFPAAGAGLAGIELRTAAQRVAAAARFAREQAIHRQRVFQLEADEAARTVSVAELDTRANRATRSFQLPEQVSVQIAPQNFGDASTVHRWLFFPDGSSEPFDVVLQSGERRLRVSADPLTGFPEVSEP